MCMHTIDWLAGPPLANTEGAGGKDSLTYRTNSSYLPLIVHGRRCAVENQ